MPHPVRDPRTKELTHLEVLPGGSERTPEVFAFDRERRLVYHGAIDDQRDEPAVRQHYVRDALDAVLEGGQPPAAVLPFG